MKSNSEEGSTSDEMERTDELDFHLGSDRHYVSLKVLGKGSFGTAVLVKDLDGCQRVMKSVDLLVLSDRQREEAPIEVKIMQRLSHPYIIRFCDAFVEGGMLAIVMDFAAFGNLRQRVDEAKGAGNVLEEANIIRWMSQSFLGVKYLHDLRIIHRDLKSENLFLETHKHIRIGDFGLARVLPKSTKLLFDKQVIGTPHFLSPEICNECLYSTASDMWALGCVLFELATLTVPFNAKNVAVLMMKIAMGPAPTLKSEHSTQLADMCASLLHMKRLQRATASQVLQLPAIRSMRSILLVEMTQLAPTAAIHMSSQEMQSITAAVRDINMKPPVARVAFSNPQLCRLGSSLQQTSCTTQETLLPTAWSLSSGHKSLKELSESRHRQPGIHLCKENLAKVQLQSKSSKVSFVDDPVQAETHHKPRRLTPLTMNFEKAKLGLGMSSNVFEVLSAHALPAEGNQPSLGRALSRAQSASSLVRPAVQHSARKKSCFAVPPPLNFGLLQPLECEGLPAPRFEVKVPRRSQNDLPNDALSACRHSATPPKSTNLQAPACGKVPRLARLPDLGLMPLSISGVEVPLTSRCHQPLSHRCPPAAKGLFRNPSAPSIIQSARVQHRPKQLPNVGAVVH